MGYSAKAIANAFLQIGNEHATPISPLKMQKLVYIAHGWSLGLTDNPLVADELPEAWEYGPVFPSLYHEFKEYGRGAITQPASEFVISPSTKGFTYEEPEVPVGDDGTWALLRRVWDQYGKFGGIALSELTHRDGTPWDVTRAKARGVKNADIPNDIILAHYKSLIDRNRARRAEGA